MVYVAFVFDVHSRRILGWRAATTMRTSLVLDCLEMALWTRRTEGVVDLSGLVHHTDAGSQYTSIAFTDRLIDHGIDASVRSVEDAHDNALAESQIGLYKTELIHPEGPLERPRRRRGRHLGLGPLVQHRTHPRIHRRSHPGRSRRGLLQSPPTPSRRGLTHKTQSPDTPGRLRATHTATPTATGSGLGKALPMQHVCRNLQSRLHVDKHVTTSACRRSAGSGPGTRR